MNENNMNTNNICNFANQLSAICGENIGLDHIHEGTGRYYYIQPAAKGAPMLLRHYRGPLFVDIHPDDMKKLKSGEVDAMEYIRSANWQVGYYWGGGSMMGGGYYQPIDIVNRTADLQRYLRILSCRTNRTSSGYMPDEARCSNCQVNNCPFSPYKVGSWENEAIKENDPRTAVFRALTKKFETLYPGYTIRGWLSSFEDGSMPNNQAWVRANSRWADKDPYSFTIWIDAKTVRELLMHIIEVEDADQFVQGFTFHHTEWDEEDNSEVTLEHIKKLYSKKGMDYPTERAAEERARKEQEKAAAKIAAERAKYGIFGFVYDLLHK